MATSTFTLRGRRGTWRHGSSLARQVWHLATSTITLRGRRGTWRHGSSLCVAGVALGDVDRHFAWQVWHLATSTVTFWQVWHLATWIVTLTTSQCHVSILSRLLLRCRYGHVYFSDTSCEHDQSDDWVVALLCIVALVLECEMRYLWLAGTSDDVS